MHICEKQLLAFLVSELLSQRNSWARAHVKTLSIFQSIMAIGLLSFAHRMMLRNEVPGALSANRNLGMQGLVSSRGETLATSLRPWPLALNSLPYCLLFLLTKFCHKISEKVYASSLLSLPFCLFYQNISSSHLPRLSFVCDRGACF